MTENGFWRMFQAVQADAGLAGRSCHSLKHTRASLMIEGGANLAEVRHWLGHKSLSSTLRYVHTTDEQAAKAARRAEANIF